MADRVDVLGTNLARLGALGGGSLDRTPDPDLQQCVEQAAAEMNAPIALVSLVLERTQFFRAHVGLPADLALSQATDRDVSFCQFVVRDGSAFEVNDAESDQRVPQDLVKRYGIRAYLGVPLESNNEVVGSLCVIDTVVRDFTADEIDLLKKVARRAGKRLEALTEMKAPARERLVQEGVAPAFSEIRNLLVPLSAGSNYLRVVASELEPLAALMSSDLGDMELARGLGALRSSARAIGEISDLAKDLEFSAERITDTVLALEQVTSRAVQVGPIARIVSHGLELAHHATKLCGGVTEPPSVADDVICAVSIGASLVSTAASALATAVIGKGKDGLVVSCDARAEDVVVAISSEHASPDQLDEIVSRLVELIGDLNTVTAAQSDNGIALTFARAAAGR